MSFYKGILTIVILGSIFLTFNACSQTNQNFDKNYKAIVDTIVGNLIKLSDQYPQISGVSFSDEYLHSNNRCDWLSIDLVDARAITLPASDYYLIFHLNFFICADKQNAVLAEKELSIGDMQVGFSISGKGNEELEAAVISIIKQEQEKFNSK